MSMSILPPNLHVEIVAVFHRLYCRDPGEREERALVAVAQMMLTHSTLAMPSNAIH